MRSRLNWYIYVLQTLHDAIVANFILSHRASLGFLDIKSKHYLDGKKKQSGAIAENLAESRLRNYFDTRVLKEAN